MNISALTLPRAIIFDWDLTLVDNWLSVHEAINAARAAYGLETWDFEQSKECCKLPLRKSFPLWFGNNWEKARKIFYKSYNKTHLELLKPLPGSEELLLWLSEQEIPSFVVSNKQGPALRKEARHLGWTNYFAAIVGSTDTERDKPDREPVDKALLDSGIIADDPNVWFVGDTETDVSCARNAGCTPVLLHNRVDSKQLDVDLSFSDCIELKSLLYNKANKNNKFGERT